MFNSLYKNQAYKEPKASKLKIRSGNNGPINNQTRKDAKIKRLNAFLIVHL